MATVIPSLRANRTDLIRRALQLRMFIVPLAFVCMMTVLVIPLPPAILDILIATNISMSAIVLLTVVYMERPLEFSVFPALLLGTTLYRLCLNIASTRLILSADVRTPEEAQYIAGHVIQAFGQFVAGNSPIVGAVIFCILIIVQFVVITKGSTRISEVAARFTLDAMPGKQMAIDADLTAGLIDENEARRRREMVTREADFYGAMDGASKFVRGDAIAGIIITVINILGGFAVGKIHMNLSITQSLSIFTKLTIGDGLVSQIPAFIIAIASGLIVARSGSKEDLGTDFVGQLTSQPRALFITAIFLTGMAFTGLPMGPMLFCALGLATLGWLVHRGITSARVHDAQHKAQEQEKAAAKAGQPNVDDLLKVDVLELEIGYGLVPLVSGTGKGGDGGSGGSSSSSSDGGLLERISMVRRQLAAELGLILPPVRIRDNAQLEADAYRLKIRGAVIAESSTHPKLWLAMDSGVATGKIDGNHIKEPAFGLDAWWISEPQRAKAESQGYTVVDAASVLITHLTEEVRKYADELLTREEVNNLVTTLKERAPKLVEEVLPEKVKPGELQKVLQSLLRERVSIRDLETIIETLGDWISHTRDVDVLVEYVRNALRRSVVAAYTTPDDNAQPRLFCITIDPRLEDVIASYVDRSNVGTTITMPPSVAGRIVQAVSNALQPLLRAGRPGVVLTSPQVRGPLRRIIETQLPNVAVLGYNEVPQGLDVDSAGLVQAPEVRPSTMTGPGAASAA